MRVPRPPARMTAFIRYEIDSLILTFKSKLRGRNQEEHLSYSQQKTIEKGRYADTNKAFQRPLKNEVDYWVEDQNGELHSEVIARELLAENRRFDETKPTTQMLGRFQPFHDGHFALFKRCYDKTGQVVIMIRAMENTSKNPFDFKTVKQNIKMFLLGEGYEENVHYIIQKVPNVVNITYGRDVGYKIEQESFDKETESISATEIRRQLGIT